MVRSGLALITQDKSKGSNSMIRILIVDDSAAVREGLSSFLEMAQGVEPVGTASDGLEAVEKARQLLPDVVLMDVQMPNVDGVEATRLIKKEFPNIGVLFFSTCSDYRDDALAAGADGYLVKDCEVRELLDKVRQIAAANSGSKETKEQGAYR